MGLFGGVEVCSVCGGKISGLIKSKICDGFICAQCIKKCSPLSSSLNLKSSTDIRHHIQTRSDNLAKSQSFTPTDAVGDYLKIDRNSRTWCCPFSDKKNPDIFSFSDLIDYELVEDGISVTKGGLGSAVVGGIAFGGVGAIVGGGLGKKQKDVTNKMSVNITVQNEFISKIEIPLITTEAKKGGFIYKTSKECANKIVSLFKIVADCNAQSATSPTTPSSTTSAAGELLKFKQLLDIDAITQEEYNAKKKQLLEL